MKIYEYTNYRTFLRDWVKKSTRGKTLNFARLAEEIRMQRPAFSKVLNGTANFSLDQVFLLAKTMGLSKNEENYLQLLVELESSGLAERKETLTAEIRKIQNREVKTPAALKTQDTIFQSDADRITYFTSAWAPMIHIFLTIPRYQAKPQKIREHIDISEVEFEKIMDLLRRMGLIKNLPGGTSIATETSVHAKEFSSLSAVQQFLLRGIQLQKLSLIPLEERYGLSVTFSADEKTREAARQILVKATTQIHELVSNAPAQSVYQLTVDLFSWEK